MLHRLKIATQFLALRPVISPLPFPRPPLPIRSMSSFSSRPSSIELTPTEDRFISLLDQFTTEGRLQIEEPKIGEVECRIAGGWVRDKLLSLPSSDVDVTLSTVGGYPFAVAFTHWLQTLPQDPPIQIRSIGKVEANPDQSKHLETATTKILGLDCDFVALRSESYADGSRIPSEVRLGTPLEDALRRDITINTLFYNVHTRQVEDWTGKGLDDMANHKIRTPLEPIQTFRDDPLRILRCIRFASRFGYTLVPELEAALVNSEILEALRTRISRERVGIEIEKMLKGPNAYLSIQLISRLGLYPHIFVLPPPIGDNTCPASNGWESVLHAASILQNILSPEGSLRPLIHPVLLSRLQDPKHSAGTVKVLWLACCMLPFKGAMTKDKKKDVPMPDMVIRDGIKLGNHDRDAVSRLFTAVDKLSNPKVDMSEPEKIRSQMGLVLRDVAVHDPTVVTHWTTSVLFSLVIDLLNRGGSDETFQDGSAQAIIAGYTSYVDKVLELDLPRLIEEKPRLDGNEVNALLNLKPSILTKSLMERVVTWQLDHPSSTKEECKEWLLVQQREGKLPTLDPHAGKKESKPKKPKSAPPPKRPRNEHHRE